jgi:hypothetical protein
LIWKFASSKPLSLYSFLMIYAWCL